MASIPFSLANRLRRALHTRLRFSAEKALVPPASRSFCTKKSPRPTLASTIWPLGHPSVSLVPELDRWAERGKSVKAVELQHIVRELRKRRRFRQALEVSEWMRDNGNQPFKPSDHAVQLDLIGQVRGLVAAENYFNSMEEKNKTDKAYGALLNCYVRERLVDKSLSHMQKMKEMGFASSAISYNNIMSLYTNTGQHEKVPSVLDEMKANGVLPDNFSYRICINSYGKRSDIDGMEKVLEEMGRQPQIVVDWNTYSVVANIYAKGGLADRAVSALKKTEEKIEKFNGLCYNHLISIYGQIGDKSEVQRIWDLQRLNCKKFVNRDYTTMLGALVKIGELEEAEALLKEWESSGNAFDIRVPNILLSEYRQRGLFEKAEAMLDGFLKKGKAPASNSWGVVAAGYAEKGEMRKAHEFMLNALCVFAPNAGWVPNPKIIKDILLYLGEEGDIQDVETFISLLRNVTPMDRDMYYTLIKASIRAGREVDELVESMKADGIEENEETQEIMSSKSKCTPSSKWPQIG